MARCSDAPKSEGTNEVESQRNSPDDAGLPLPQIRLGPHSVSRLILGANPINGGSHLSVFVNQQMREYFTPENVMALFRRCQEVGINAWQSGGRDHERWQRFRDQGGEMHYLCIAADQPDSLSPVAEIARAGAIGIAHHGEVTDSLWKAGKIEQARGFLARVRDAGVLVGVSTHIPAVIEYVEEKGWDVDYYMACLYERHRTGDELRSLLGEVPVPVGEVYLSGDPARMCKVMRQTAKPCLAFKILAAGRLCEHPQQVEQAFRFAFANIKPNDAVIVGMYPRYSDQPGENAELTRRFGTPAAEA